MNPPPEPFKRYYWLTIETTGYSSSPGETGTTRECYAIDAPPFTWFARFLEMERLADRASRDPYPNPYSACAYTPMRSIYRFEEIPHTLWLDAREHHKKLGYAISIDDIEDDIKRLKHEIDKEKAAGSRGVGGPYR